MNWIAFAVLGLGLYVQWTRRKKCCGVQAAPATAQTQEPSAEEVAEDLATSDPERMARLLERSEAPLTRHTLMTRMAEMFYKERENERMRHRFKEVAEQYREEFDARIGPHFQRSEIDLADEAPLFKWLAIVLEQEGDYEAALAVCRQALAWKLRDGTKTGYEGRILRIEKKRLRDNQPS